MPAVLNTTGGGDAIVLRPALLDANTEYTFEVTSGLKDTAGGVRAVANVTFTTGTHGRAGVDTSVAFEKVALPTPAGTRSYTGVTIGPDGKLYA